MRFAFRARHFVALDHDVENLAPNFAHEFDIVLTHFDRNLDHRILSVGIQPLIDASAACFRRFSRCIASQYFA
jgi:hypothetical protein